VEFGRATIVRRGVRGTVVAVGPVLSSVLEATAGLDVSVLYYTTICPFDAGTLRENCALGAIVVVEPFYEGTLAQDVMSSVKARAIQLLSIGVPRRFLTSYGDAADHDEQCGLRAPQLRTRLEEFFHDKG